MTACRLCGTHDPGRHFLDLDRGDGPERVVVRAHQLTSLRREGRAWVGPEPTSARKAALSGPIYRHAEERFAVSLALRLSIA